ncbi:MAG: hypothetical protein J6D47_04040 [Peptostreptococcaceae bacterium]|nr:hypothetical protein [Peptostreptococcaceae bacterium]
MERLFTIEGLRISNKNIKFFRSDMFMDCEEKIEDNLLAKDIETLTTFLCASLDSMGSYGGLGIAFMNDSTCFIAIQSIGKIYKMYTIELIKNLNALIDDFDIANMTILQQAKYDSEQFYFISNELVLN